ncbi:Uma2 family endonuclease [Streptomyces sp. NPDC048219]|uniref:Uma2 family endonuclease n=1 Tax=unclassified Streptomyces TaxID=2593676 RepID=UPI00371E6A63
MPRPSCPDHSLNDRGPRRQLRSCPQARFVTDQTRVPAAAVVLTVEVVSPDSVSRDRETKPLKYARAGITHYWRVENEKGLAVVHAFELEPTTGAYTGVGIFRERMKVSAPFPMDLDLSAIKARRSGE